MLWNHWLKVASVGVFLFFFCGSLTASEPFVIHRLPTTQNVVALTFDDGPFPHNTRALTNILSWYRIKATFFMVARSMKLYPDVVKRVHKAGHTIGNHSYEHHSYDTLSKQEILDDISRSQHVFMDTIGEYPRLFRPPYGKYNPDDLELLSKFYDRIVLWNVDPEDWRRERDPSDIVDMVMAQVKPGSIILFHAKHGPTLKALPRIIHQLKRQGYRFVLIEDLLKR